VRPIGSAQGAKLLRDMIERMGTRFRNSRRIIARVIVFLLLGAIVNVAVAWGCTIPSWSITLSATPVDGPSWPLKPKNSWSTPPNSVARATRFGLAFESWHDTRTNGRYASMSVRRAGWPNYGLRCSSWHELYAGQTKQQVTSFDAVMMKRPFATERWLPLRPIWPGFAVNTLFYAGILWLLFAAPFALRRRRRIKRGLCPACAYPVGDSEVCTECGKPVRRKAVSA
jgi:hypothetical protein